MMWLLIGVVCVLALGALRAVREWILGIPPSPFKVTPIGRDELRYTEHGRRVMVLAEPMVNGDRVLYAGSIKEWDDARPISEAERERIIANVVAWQERLKRKMIVDRTP